MKNNQLDQETSPYLLQHKNNPVHWMPWGPGAFIRAKNENKPILLSIGYSACHWCHVMAHESFENKDIAKLMNELYINIKVDREERPDIDNIYQASLAMLGEQGGWPLTMFLTERAEPFWGGTYFPPDTMYGRPGFTHILKEISQTYKSENKKIQSNVEALKKGLQNLNKNFQQDDAKEKEFDSEDLRKLSEAFLSLVDHVNGGTKGSPKFPQPGFFEFLWNYFNKTKENKYKDAVTNTLNKICQGGIYDHIGGGFSRYSTDTIWLAPHFEKMLYDNALLIKLLTQVWRTNKSKLYKTRINETIAWVLREMRTPKNQTSNNQYAFASAYDADSEGIEGKFYVWKEHEIDRVLGERSKLFKDIYDVTPFGNWENKTILNRSNKIKLEKPDIEKILAESKQKLFNERSKRVYPSWDDKVLTDWNGLMIDALAEAGATFDRVEWIKAAQTAFEFICNNMTKENRFLHSWREGKAKHPAIIDDYANMSLAALKLYEITGKCLYLNSAIKWVKVANQHYWDKNHTGYFLSADDTTDIIIRTKTTYDNATPSGNNIMVIVLVRLYYMTGEKKYKSRAELIIKKLCNNQIETMIAMPVLLSAYNLLNEAIQIIIVGEKGDNKNKDLFNTAFKSKVVNKVIMNISPDEKLHKTHPGQGKTQLNNKATAYVCVGSTCSLPITEKEILDETLNKNDYINYGR